MKKIYAVIAFLLISASSFAQFGIYATAAYIKINGVSSFYNCMTPGNGQNVGGLTYQGTDLGIYGQNTGQLVLVGAEIKTYKGANDNVCSGTVYFTVYPVGMRPANPVFMGIGLGFYSNCTDPACMSFPNSFPAGFGGGCCNPNDQKWQNPGGGNGGGGNGNIDLTTYPPGAYTLEMYYQATGEDNNAAGCAATKYDNNSTNPTNYAATFSITGVAPVHFGSISATNLQSTNRISWTTLTEQNTSYFTIERAANGLQQFEPIGKIAAAGNSSAQKQYSFIDRQPQKGVNFYRILMTENGGDKKYSPVVLAHVSPSPGKALAYPNPAKTVLHLYAPTQGSNLQVYNADGAVVHKAVMNGQFYDLSVTGLPNGRYFAQISHASGNSTVSFLVSK